MDEKKPEEEKKADEEHKPEEKKVDEEHKPDQPNEEKIKSDESKEPAIEIALKVYMHCEGCAKKVRRCLKGFEGIDDVFIDCKNHKVIIKGDKVDPLKILERVQKKSHRKVELISPIPSPPPAAENVKPEVNETPKLPEEVITVILRVYMHCEACAEEFKRQILKMDGVENVEPDLKNSQVSVKGIFDPVKLLDHVSKRTGKQAVIVKQEPEKKEDEVKKTEDAAMEKKEVCEEKVKKNELYYYYPSHNQIDHQFVYQNYPSQIFSDENPNGCSVM
ncbi:heavy metal-associated isoprenylated plant protein 7-like isoform X2 [Impatiens glandulifera]|uniref:heavy metal-associated isoprenylated plant protein 7-like isoform X2 n=1 Tax=Impatiens glandulifera TaxID=253017 RepID=UPI001FB04C13|nr:heavy metal-associated isoprenylated plant protein 7-like isoform X2 [Impatiens glandulifera]